MANKTVVFSKGARNSLEKLLAFLETEWSIKVKKEYRDKLERCVLQISKHPDSCPVSEEFPGLHKCVVTKQTTFYYRVNDKEVQVITFYDNRQDPKKLKPLL